MSNFTLHSPESLEQSSLNFFQLAAIQLKIRYNAGLSFAATEPSTIASLWYKTIATHGAHLQVGLARLANDPTKARPLLVRQPLNIDEGGASSKIKLNFAPPIVAPLEGRSLEEILVSNLYPETELPITGPALLFLFTNEKNEAVSLVVNLCAALWDATTISSILQTFMTLLHETKNKKMPASSNSPAPSMKDLYTQLGGWEKYIQQEASKNNQEPIFLPMISSSKSNKELGNIVGITDILQGPPAKTLQDRRVSVTFDAEIVGGCKNIMEPRGVTLGKLMNACFVFGLAEIYFREHLDESIVTLVQSTQLDPRTLLGDDNIPRNYIQALGIISHGSTVTRDELASATLSSPLSFVEWLVTEAKRIDADIQTRMERGEGLHRTLEIATGKIDPSQRVAACIEIVDHGGYDTPSEEYSIELGHRMDICPHTSIVVHSELASGKIKVEAQIGKEQGRDATVQWLNRCTELWKLVATST